MILSHHFKSIRKEKIIDIDQLKPGDHVSFYNRVLSNSYHGIVREARTNYLLVIHYFNIIENVWDSLIQGSLYLTEVIQSEWKVIMNSENEEIYVHHYDNIKCLSNEETLERAVNYLGKRGYSLVGNNSEHWARWCRSGNSYSEQAIKLHNLVKDKAATLLIVDAGALLIKDVAIVDTQNLGPFLGAIGSGVIFTTVASISTFIHIKKERNKRQKGDLSDIAFKKYVVRRIATTSGTIIGRTAGTIVGTILIPVPILGSGVGAVIGTVSGKMIGSLSGIAISKVLEIYKKQKQEKISQMKTVPQLSAALSPESQFFQVLRAFVLDPEQAARTETTSDSSILYMFFKQLVRSYSNLTKDECQMETQQMQTIFLDSNTFEYFVLVPVSDENSPEEFASTIDLLLLRWPIRQPQPWNIDEEHVLDISDLKTTNI
ncbi:unnamed protein product [Rotaria sp. Silwood1]|nr:unnamed protein product [Rotaria sp. Silwood1]CAF3657725.1 unnamed protein product [Rotaria sp. Silwood1]CAF4844259.1 unnamed protein product [Rotaria sp. Silwood1]CAF4888896.1 unnamed protein product [Rotaria sp. Silwood1]